MAAGKPPTWQQLARVRRAASQLVRLARAYGVVVTIEEQSLKPLASGNTTPRVNVRPKRGHY